MTGYGVKIVADDRMPPEVEWMYVWSTDGTLLLCLRRSAAGNPRVLAEAWAGYRAMERPPEPPQPDPTPAAMMVPLQREVRLVRL